MNFSTDRDLLAHEPSVFLEAASAAQQRLSVTDAALSGTTLTSASADFIAAGVDAGGVVLVSDQAHEVVSRTDGQTLTVSLPRARLSDDAIAGVGGSSLVAIVRTFAPQAALVHDGLLRLLAIDPEGDGDSGGGLTEDAIVSLSLMGRLEALGTLERVYSSAGMLLNGGWRDTLLLKAERYRARFREALSRAKVLIDADGDGYADRAVYPGQVQWVRR